MDDAKARHDAVGCHVYATAPVNPSEDPTKVAQSVSYVLPGCQVKIRNTTGVVVVDSNESDLLMSIRESIRARQSARAYLRILGGNLKDNTTWFYLNKQAAFVGKIALCADAEESALGPIKITITSSNIDGVIDWLTSF